ncbi:MAG: hypothetical protein JXA74_02010 [Anaerolineae bacterium]|nr:hypothetical protein [Anaerolineae bacterium]
MRRSKEPEMLRKWLAIIAVLGAIGAAVYFGFSRYVVNASSLEEQEPIVELSIVSARMTD